MKGFAVSAPFAGRSFEVRYEGLAAINQYDADGRTMRYRITEGPLRGAEGEAHYQWTRVAEGIFAISWQEADGSTVVHVDDFDRGTSLSFFTTPDGRFHRLDGRLRARLD
ncbi:MoaF-related domain-containing protein [Pseudoxanthomonas sp.]|uniref:MoaF-related domain-containing protein n=1 Tax=Pseudoxanthomonas sp. TaxID=1871049 RepID=UPI003F7FD7BC